MGSNATLKPLLVTAAISLVLFLVTTYVALPLWRRARQRYAQYIPLESLSSQTSSLAQRVQVAFSRFIWTPVWQHTRSGGAVVGSDAFEHRAAAEDGEELGHVGPTTRSHFAEDAHRSGLDNTRRLSRDLEEGFRDDSSDDGRNDRNNPR